MPNEKNSTPNPAVGPDTLPAVLSPEEVVQFLRAVRERMPMPDADLSAVSRKRRTTHVDAKFVEASINAVGAISGVQGALGRTDEECRQEIDLALRWTAVADELRSLLHTTLAANTVRRQRIGLAALQTYQICQQLAREGKDERLEVHIREMRRLNRFGRARRKPADDEILKSKSQSPTQPQ